LRDANVIKIKGTQIVITDGDGLARAMAESW